MPENNNNIHLKKKELKYKSKKLEYKKQKLKYKKMKIKYWYAKTNCVNYSIISKISRRRLYRSRYEDTDQE